MPPKSGRRPKADESRGSIEEKTRRTRRKPVSLQCDQCGDFFKSSTGFLVHQRSHSGERPFACALCPKAFSTAISLRIHQNIHAGRRTLACPMCGKGFYDWSTLQVHQRQHTGETPFACHLCGKTTKQASNLKSHYRHFHKIFDMTNEQIRLNAKQRPDQKNDSNSDNTSPPLEPEIRPSLFSRDISGVSVVTLHEIGRHMDEQHQRLSTTELGGDLDGSADKTAGNAKPEPDQKSDSNSNKTSPLKPETKPSLFSCDICGASVVTIHAIRRHMDEQHHQRSADKTAGNAKRRPDRKIDSKNNRPSTKPPTFSCDICGVSMRTKCQIERHMDAQHRPTSIAAAEHSRDDDATTVVQDFTYWMSPKIARPTDDDDDKDRRSDSHREDKKPTISKKRSRKPVCLQCDQCGDVLKSLTGFRIHQRRHTGERPFACALCPKAFTTPESLRMHQDIHAGRRTLACPICRRGFNDRSTMWVHQRQHTGETPYACHLCGKATKQASNLKSHYRHFHKITDITSQQIRSNAARPQPYSNNTRPVKRDMDTNKASLLSGDICGASEVKVEEKHIF